MERRPLYRMDANSVGPDLLITMIMLPLLSGLNLRYKI